MSYGNRIWFSWQNNLWYEIIVCGVLLLHETFVMSSSSHFVQNRQLRTILYVDSYIYYIHLQKIHKKLWCRTKITEKVTPQQTNKKPTNSTYLKCITCLTKITLSTIPYRYQSASILQYLIISFSLFHPKSHTFIV